MAISLDLPLLNYLRKIFHYDAKEGSIYWLPRDLDFYKEYGHAASEKQKRFNSKWANKEAGSFIKNKIPFVSIDNVDYYIPSIIWYLHYGTKPKNTPLPLDGDFFNTNINNLSDSTSEFDRQAVQTNKLPIMDYLNKFFRYDAILGHLYKKKYNRDGVYLKESLIELTRRHKTIYINGGYFSAIRIIWALAYNEDPMGFVIDHISGNYLDNSLKNLAKVTHSENISRSKKQRVGRMMANLKETNLIKDSLP
jgi:hypothetical protein